MKDVISEPETVLLTLLAFEGSKLIGCEGYKDWHLCKHCPIKKWCYFRTLWVFKGGTV